MKKEIKMSYLMQDLGLLGFLICIIGVILSIYSTKGDKIEYLVMFLILCVPILFCIYKMPLFSLAVTGAQTLAYAIYKLYQWSAWNETITTADYVWLFIPAVAMACLQIFVYGMTAIELKNEILREQVDELVYVDALTGLYNRRGLYNDLTRQIAYAKRNGMKMGLMVMKLKYEQELKNILSDSQFRGLRQTLAEIVEDSLRVEDRLYAADEDGTLVVLLTCDKAGAEIVERRLKAAVSEKDAFRDIVEHTLKVEIKVGYVEYEEEKITNAMDFLQQAENEVQYDV